MSTLQGLNDRQVGDDSTEAAEEPSRYYVDLDLAKERNRSAAAMVAERRCYTDRQADSPESVADSNAKDHIKRITTHCADTSDYLLPDTPFKEAIFRVLLAHGNEPMTAVEISDDLTTRWALSTNRRDISPRVVQRLLDNSQSYCIVVEPRPEPEPEPEALVEEQPVASLEPEIVAEVDSAPDAETGDDEESAAESGDATPEA